MMDVIRYISSRKRSESTAAMARKDELPISAYIISN